jgi:uncharacterized protein YbaR (Trm112 family)
MQEAPMAISAELLAILVCPVCKGELAYRPEKPSLDCTACALSYPVREDIPVMLVDEAEKLDVAKP